jgi:hypothetical protein
VPTPVFSLTAGATVDEGNNWINISWGPLSLITPTTEVAPPAVSTAETLLGNYSLAAGSNAIGYITPVVSGTTYTLAPPDDFFGNLRKTNNAVDAGAVEFAAGGGGGGGAATVSATQSPSPITFPTPIGNAGTGTATVTLTNTTAAGGASVTIANVAVSGGTVGTWFFNAVVGQNTCTGATLAPGQTCTVGVRFTNVTSAVNVTRTGTITFTDNATGSPQSFPLSGLATP